MIFHVYSDKNKGDQGIVLSTIAQLNKYGYNASLLSQYARKDRRFKTDHQHFRNEGHKLFSALFPEPDIRHHDGLKKGSIIKKIILFFFYLLKNQLYILCFKLNKNLPLLFMNSAENDTWQAIRAMDVVIAKGGSYFYCLKNITSLFFYFRMLYVAHFLKKVGKRVILFPQSMGPWQLAPAVWLSRSIFKGLDAIIVREKKSLTFLQDQGINNSNIFLLADIALFFEKSTTVAGFAEKLGKFNAGISARPYTFTNKQNEKNYINSMVSAIKFFCRQSGGRVFLFPQVTGPTEDEDDRPVLQKIYDYFRSDPAVVLLEGEYSAGQLRHMYGKMDLLVATRLHAAIFAMSSNVPAIAISYHGTKTTGFFELMAMDELALDIETITPSQVQQLISKVLPHLKEYRTKINQRRQEFAGEYERVLSHLL